MSAPEATRLLPRRDRPTAGPRERTPALPADLLGQSASRLRAVALLYAFVYFFSGFFPALLFPADRALLFASPRYWVPGAISIGLALVVAAVTRSRRAPLPLIMSIGLAFEVVSSYFIASAEFLLDPATGDMLGHWMGLSWVAVWTPLFTVVIPTRPAKALMATIASVSAVPLVIGWMILSGRTTFQVTAIEFFFGIIFPYILITALAYAGQRVVYALGKEATRAQELGSYRLIERLGKGGMGEVWKASHRLLARPAAIKLLQTNSGAGEDADAMRRFEREAQVTSQLRSAHTVELWDFGVAGDGRFYYVMELLDGLDLDALVKRYGPVSAERAIFLLRQVCHSLAEAEAHGLVHRDIKPANILMCRYGGEHDFIKVLDFGIVKVTHAATRDSIATQENVLRGTPAFIAPEQVLSAGAIDSRADIYSVGCVAYWLLTGDLVFRGDTPIAVMMHHAHTTPVPVSQRAELPIPPELDRLILSCLEKDPAKRPQSARELSRQLAEIPIATPWTEERAQLWWSRHEPDVQPAATSAS